LSARTAAALDAASRRLAEHLAANPSHNVADVAFTLQTGRHVFAHRRMVVVRSVDEAIEALTTEPPRADRQLHQTRGEPSVVFAFPGQGSQYPGMTRELYATESAFRAAIDRCAAVLDSELGRDIRELLFQAADEAAADALRQTSVAQAAIFSVEYALATLWQSWGIHPAAMIGHSVGEFVCAVLADVLTLEDALRLVAARGRLMQELPAGAMLAVPLSAEQLAARLAQRPSIAIATENAPALCVVSGPNDDIERLQAELEAEGVVVRTLVTSHAFHSPMMDPAVEPFEALAREVQLRVPQLPFVSTVSGTWITPEQATDPTYWSRHLRLPVRFATGLRTLLDSSPRFLLEVGPRGVLTSLARRQLGASSEHHAVASIGDAPNGELTALLEAVGQLWLHGVAVNWRALHNHQARQRVVLPTYPFERQRYWIDPAPIASPAQVSAQNSLVQLQEPPVPDLQLAPSPAERRIVALQELIEQVTGIEMAGTDARSAFVELGLDSLLLTQLVLQVQKRFSVKLTFRQLMENYHSPLQLAEYLDSQLPPAPAVIPGVRVMAADVTPPPVAIRPDPGATVPATITTPKQPITSTAAATTVEWVIDQQLKLMAQQLALLGGTPAAVTPAPLTTEGSMGAPVAAQSEVLAVPAASAEATPPSADPDEALGPVKYEAKKAFGAIARIHLSQNDPLTPKQQARLDAFIRRYTARTRESKRLTQINRSHLADPRAVTGFRPLLKEVVYQITVDRSSGSRVWDVDGNEYIDVLNGFGACFFGWQPSFITEAVTAQLARGYEIGPMHPLAGEVSRLICDLTGFERAGFCNTGSEAVLGAIRVARTVTGRNTIAMFSGAYHGINDEVIVRGTKKLRAIPAAPGILPETAANVLVLDYGTPESLEILRQRADDLAGILVEPVQSRRPDFQPREFLHELRRITHASGTALIMDELVTGFRTAPGGAQEYFGVRGDMATYGKVIGGGFPMGVIAGTRQWLDALDGGYWQYGDASTPPAGVTYFAGTFVRHPLALAAAKAVLQRLKQEGPSLQLGVSELTATFAAELNAHLKEVGAPLEIRNFGSLWKAFYTEEQPHGDLLFLHLRDHGVHILDGFPCFFTTAHTIADVAQVAKAFRDSVAEMQEAGFLPERAKQTTSMDLNSPPVPGARLGRDRDGSPAWFIPNPNEHGKYMKVHA
ncbi:MAG: aminotransferase class III-fold pyridoxal phosphate-dependent enzyme, partial [Chloroflexota bacterium]|nr:aminotransferase class III-fold pyridoxal phosphate-dependent enzyme [Chloroflexota bacterium]